MNIHLFCFDAQELPSHVQQLESLGYTVDSRTPDGPDFLKQVKQNPPDIFIIDLTRIPSQGRDLGVYFRHAKATRLVPLVFVGGAEEKVKGVQKILPDAVYSTWAEIDKAVIQAVENPLINPVAPESVMAAYSGAPLVKKLGIKENIKLGLINAPKNVNDILGELPSGVSFFHLSSDVCDLYLWFLTSAKQLEDELAQMVRAAENGRIWMIWPKKSSSLASDLNQQIARDNGLSSGLVDYKVCSVDKDWTGLLFTKRKLKKK